MYLLNQSTIGRVWKGHKEIFFLYLLRNENYQVILQFFFDIRLFHMFYCREEENLIFVSARYLIQHWISPNQDDLSHSARTFISG